MVSKREVRITAAEYAEAIGPLITRVLEPVRQVLEDLAIVPDDIDSVLMTGGTPAARPRRRADPPSGPHRPPVRRRILPRPAPLGG
ncbi:Hsp70 family protein [Streptomyces sp. NPDC093991]|uniref:Hsp70 family protein n=1 Tax=unclassified Streptomyces TaxID=2593676 RepID=UPI003442A0A7